MSNYIGVKCPVCNKKFTQTDDIVVCPICGAPHHRECYAKNSACVFAADHLSGREWRAPPPDPSAREDSRGDGAPGVIICPGCNSSNREGTIFCQTCGKILGETASPNQNSWGFPGFGFEIDPVSLMYGGLSPDDKIEDETARDLAVYIGENSAYYLPKFKTMHETSRTLTFNFSALLFNFIYFFYRKMYLAGSLLLALFVIGAIPSFLQAREMLPEIMYSFNLGPDIPVNNQAVEHYRMLVNVTGTINFLICLVVSFCANRFYYMKVMSDVKKIRLEQPEPRDERSYSVALSRSGGVSRLAVTIVVICIAIAYFMAAGVMSYQYMESVLSL